MYCVLVLSGLGYCLIHDHFAVVCDGHIAARVRQEGLDQKADLLVTGRGHDQGSLARIFSHLYEMVREAPCPVLSI